MTHLTEQHHIAARIDGEQVSIHQVNKQGARSCIMCARSQLIELANQVQGIASQSETARRFSVLAGEWSGVINDDDFREELTTTPSGSYWLARLDAAMALAFEFDGGLAPRQITDPASQESEQTATDDVGDTNPSPKP